MHFNYNQEFMKLRIKEIMAEKNITSVWLANNIGVTKATISNLINDKTMPSLETLEKIADALEVPMWELFASMEDIQGEAEKEREEEEGILRCPKCGTRFKEI